jgi:ketosteroid isomerase-like protein
VWEETDVQTRAFGDTVIVVGKLRLEGEGATFVPGRDPVKAPGSRLGPTTLSFTRVWIKRDGKWLLAAIHNALPPPAPQGK